MKVILKEPVSGLGRMGEVVNVADGYARNFLVPKGLAEIATAGALRDWEQKKHLIAKREAQEIATAEGLAASLRDKEVIIEAKAGEAGKLYGSVTSKEIAAAIEEQLKIEVDRKKIEIAESIKELGVHPVTVKVHAGVETTVNVNVVESKEE